MKNTLLISLTGITAFALVACKNPAKESSAATTSESKEIPTGALTGKKWIISSSDSAITFIGSKVTGNQSGGFKDFSGHFHVNGETLSPHGHEVVIDMHSTFTESEKLTKHLKNADFFDVEKYPESKFVVSGIEEKSGEKGQTHLLTGNFSFHGITKSIIIPVAVEQSDDSINVKADFFINRFDFDVQYAGRADDLIRKEVVIRFDLNATPAK